MDEKLLNRKRSRNGFYPDSEHELNWDEKADMVNGEQFLFFDKKSLNEFADQLRQSFEYMFVFGCRVSYTYPPVKIK